MKEFTNLAEKKELLEMAVSAERDKYVKHHRGFGGTSYVYINDENDLRINYSKANHDQYDHIDDLRKKKSIYQ
jgi:hypothetical protein